MSDCCAVPSTKGAFVCPVCHQKGRAVGSETVQAIAKSNIEIKDEAYRFCLTLDCPVIYFDEQGGQINKSQVRVRVGIKETEDPVPVCYCFGFTEGDVFEDIRTMGTTRIPDKIRDEIKAENCKCEIKNPSGACCLGNVSKAVKRALQGHTKNNASKSNFSQYSRDINRHGSDFLLFSQQAICQHRFNL